MFLNQLLYSPLNEQALKGFPFYNVMHDKEKDEYILEVALSGYGLDDLEITAKQGSLTIASKKNDDAESRFDYIFRGFAKRSFTRTFKLAPHVEVKEAIFKEGVLRVKMQVILPDSLKPRKVEIKREESTQEGRQYLTEDSDL